jgi:hypothetical protein
MTSDEPIEALLEWPRKIGCMALEAEMRRKIVVSVVAVGFFIALIVGVGAAYNDGGLVGTGGLVLVGAITLFVVVMGLIGVWLDR